MMVSTEIRAKVLQTQQIMGLGGRMRNGDDERSVSLSWQAARS